MTTHRRKSLVRTLIPRTSSLGFLWNSKKKLALLLTIFGGGFGGHYAGTWGWLMQQLNLNGQTQTSQYNPYGNPPGPTSGAPNNNPYNSSNNGNSTSPGDILKDLRGEITNAINNNVLNNNTPTNSLPSNKGNNPYTPSNVPVNASLNAASPVASGETIHIASFNIQVFGEKKLANQNVVNILSQVVRQFDIVAIQEVRSVQDDVLPRFLQAINATGRHYDFIIGPRMGRSVSKEQYAFIFDTARIEVDRQSAYAVGDPTSRMQRAPFVAHFRVRGPDPREAFTFKLVDVHTEPDATVQELNACADVFNAVANDGSNEDDIILLGDLNVDDKHFENLGRIPGITCAISGKPTNTRQTKQYDNIVFNSQKTVEYTGRSGVYNLVKEFHLSLDDAILVSDHFPIWAEFSVYENDAQGRFANRQRNDSR